MIYLASPYSHPDAHVRIQRFNQVCRIAGALMLQGQVVFSPIAQSHPVAMEASLPTTWDYWKKFDEEFIAASDRLVVAMMDGWESSVGVNAEIAIAHRLGKPVEYLTVGAIA